MKFTLKPLHSLLLAGLLASVSVIATAQQTAPPTPGPANAAAHNEHRMHHDPGQRQAFMAKRQTELKEKLKITPAQESAWATYSASSQQPAGASWRVDRAELAKLPTPERIDKMRALRTQRMTEMNAYLDKRGDATKALYAALSPEQQKLLDASFGDRGGHGGDGSHSGKMGRHHRPG